MAFINEKTPGFFHIHTIRIHLKQKTPDLAGVFSFWVELRGETDAFGTVVIRSD